MANIRQAKQELKLVRDKITTSNSTQLANLLKPISANKLNALQKAVAKAMDGKKNGEIEARKKLIKKLQAEVAALEKD